MEDLSPVERWRMSAFLDAGFSSDDAYYLTRSPAFVHDVLKALERGCSLELAIEIFL